jgi:hypothetical protein
LTYNRFLPDGINVYEPLVTRANDYGFLGSPVIRITVRNCFDVQHLRIDVIQNLVAAINQHVQASEPVACFFSKTSILIY